MTNQQQQQTPERERRKARNHKHLRIQINVLRVVCLLLYMFDTSFLDSFLFSFWRLSFAFSLMVFYTEHSFCTSTFYKDEFNFNKNKQANKIEDERIDENWREGIALMSTLIDAHVTGRKNSFIRCLIDGIEGNLHVATSTRLQFSVPQPTFNIDVFRRKFS